MRSPDGIFVSNYYFWKFITADPDDDKFVDCAITANADFQNPAQAWHEVAKGILSLLNA